MYINPFDSYTDKQTKKSVYTIKKEVGKQSILYKNLSVPIIVSLGTYIKKHGDANFFSPYVRLSDGTITPTIYKEHADTCLTLAEYNLSFLLEKDIIKNKEQYYNKAIRYLLQNYVHGIDNQIGSFSTDYDNFKKQILNLIKDNLAYIVPSENTLSYKTYIKTFGESDNIIEKNNKSIYKNLTKEGKSKAERIFIKLSTLITKIQRDEKYLEPLFNDIQSISKENDITIQNQ